MDRSRMLGVEIETAYSKQGAAERTPLFTRFQIPARPQYTIHLFHRGDQDEAWHDHKQGFYTFPLVSYVDEVLDLRTGEIRQRLVRAFRWHWRPMNEPHRILGRAGRSLHEGCGCCLPTWEIKPGKILTLCYWAGKRREGWGFYVRTDREDEFRYVPWQVFVNREAGHAPV